MKHSLLLPACSCLFLLLLSIASCFCLFAFDLRFCFRLPLASSWFLPLRFRALPGSCSCTWPSCSCSLLSSFVYFFLSLASCFLLLLASCLFLLPLRLELRNAGFKSTTKRAAKPPNDFLHALDSACCWCLGKFACGPWQKVTLRRAKTTWQ